MDNIKRVILKLSGEALAKKEGGYNDEPVSYTHMTLPTT